MPPLTGNSQVAPVLVAAGICPRTTPTNNKAQQSFGASFNHSGVGFWEVDFSTMQPGLDPKKVLLGVTLGDGSTGTNGMQYGVSQSAGPLWAISTFLSSNNVQTDCDLHLTFSLMPSQF